MLLALSLSAIVRAAEAWRSVDAQGNVEYSDTPRPGAVRIELPDPQPAPVQLPADEGTAVPDDVATDEPTASAVAYSEIAIRDPANDDTVRDNGGNLIVSVTLKPRLQVGFGHQLRLLLDGSVYATGTSRNFALTEIDRGTHVVQAVVIGADGEPLATSAPVRFHLHRMSVQQIERRNDAPQDADK